MTKRLKEGNFYGSALETPVIIKEIDLNKDGDFLPVSGGRSSQPDALNTFAPKNKMQEIPLDFSVEWLDTLENLAAYNSDIGYALDNIVQLANTPHDIYFDDNVKESDIPKMKAHLIEREKEWYENSGGLRSLKADLLAQIVINGSLSAEAYPDKKLKGIEQVVRIAPKNIRFKYNKATGRHDAYQKVNGHTTEGLLKLNPKTYKYIALRRYFASPYATPPFIAAIDALCTQKDMMENFKQIMKKLGMLGFLTAEVTAPTQRPGESENAYWDRCVKYLNDVVYPQLDKNLSKGIVAGFKDTHTFNLQGNNMNVQGATGLFDLVQSRIFAGVKQDPNMMGVNHATTETFGRIILAKLLSQTADYQGVVDSFFSYIYLFELRLAGFNLQSVQVVSQKPMVTDKVKEEDAESKRIDNTKKKRDMGIISQETAANELGYEKAHSEWDIVSEVEEENTEEDVSEESKKYSLEVRQLEYKLKSHIEKYPYLTEYKCGVNLDAENFDTFEGTNVDVFIKKYFNDIAKTYKKASKHVSEKIGNLLLEQDEGIPLEQVQSLAYLTLLKEWDAQFKTPIKTKVKNNITSAWEKFRKDKSIFKGNENAFNKSSFKIPLGVLDLDDFRAIEFMEKSDMVYLGKFITDPDTKRRFYKLLNKMYLEEYTPIGNNEKDLKKFISELNVGFQHELWKIRRIIDTTMNKVRNYSSVYYMSQAYVQKFEVVEMMDDITCDYCEYMNGMIFDVKLAKEQIQKEFNSDPETISSIKPFLVTKSLDDLKEMNASDLQKQGFDCPSYHPHCRGMVIASFD